MYFKKALPVLLAIVVIVLSSSCANKKKFIYFTSPSSIPASDQNKNYNPVLKSDDLLSIIVTAQDMDAVKPFNVQSSNNFNNNIGGYATGAPTAPGFLVDSDGNVDLPVIGKVKVAGLSRTTAVELIRDQLKTYVLNPGVTIRILNYKVTVLGEVRNPGTFTIPNERITLLEAIGIAGDLNITGVRKNVLVIRDDNGKKTEYRVDLTAKDLFASPVYYLNQNDVVYVEPNRTKINSSVINPANAGIIISAVSLIVSVLVLITR